MRASEWIVVGYLLYLVAFAWILRLPSRRRALVTVVGGLDVAVTWWLAGRVSEAASLARDWVPALQILIGYWLSGAFYRGPMLDVEAWLMRWDRRLFDSLGLASLALRGPRAILEYLEFSYLSVYILVPLGFGLAVVLAPQLDVDRYWMVVLTAELSSYAMLPWIQTRPPRALGDHMAIDLRHVTLRRLNLVILQRGSIQVNTVPSGHAAGAFATALAVTEVDGTAGAALFVLAASIVAGSVVGRYHYAADSVLGILVAVIAWVVL